MIKIAMPEIKKIEALAQSLKAISFAQAAVRVGGVNQNIKKYVQTILDTDKADYYQSVIGLLSLREKIAEKLSLKHTTPLVADNIIISHGSVGAFASLCAALLETGDEVIIPEPTYPTYKNTATFFKAVPVKIPAFVSSVTSSGDLSWELDIDQIKAATTSKTKMLIFPNPVNPLGLLLSPALLQELVAWCESRSIYLVVDEVYDDYIFEGVFSSITPFVASSSYVIRLGSFSKNFAMSGWRVGYAVVPTSLIPILMAVQDVLLCCPNVPGQYAALYALDHHESIAESYALVSKSRDIVLQMLEPFKKQGIFTYAQPAAGFCIFLKTDHKDATDLALDILHTSLVALVPGKDFGDNGSSYLRLCYARFPEVTQEGMQRLANYFKITP